MPPTGKPDEEEPETHQEEGANEEEVENEEEFSVEKILDMRMDRRGRRLYKIKWVGYSEDQCTWEPEENLSCPELLAQFNEARRKKDAGPKRAEPAAASATPAGGSKRKKTDEATSDTESATGAPAAASAAAASAAAPTGAKPRGFDRGKQPEKIIGATDAAGELMFLIKWKDCDEADLVPAKVANVRCPQTVIQFYEERLTWHSHEENDAGNLQSGAQRSARAPVPAVPNTPALPEAPSADA